MTRVHALRTQLDAAEASENEIRKEIDDLKVQQKEISSARREARTTETRMIEQTSKRRMLQANVIPLMKEVIKIRQEKKVDKGTLIKARIVLNKQLDEIDDLHATIKSLRSQKRKLREKLEQTDEKFASKFQCVAKEKERTLDEHKVIKLQNDLRKRESANRALRRQIDELGVQNAVKRRLLDSGSKRPHRSESHGATSELADLQMRFKNEKKKWSIELQEGSVAMHLESWLAQLPD